LADSLEILVEIPSLALLAGGATATDMSEAQTAVHVQKLNYHPDAPDIWNLPAAAPVIVGALDTQGAVPLIRCALPLPAPEEVALYRITLLKAGTAHDTQGQIRNEQLLPTEEELLFFVIGADQGASASLDALTHIVPGIQYVVVPGAGQ